MNGDSSMQTDVPRGWQTWAGYGLAALAAAVSIITAGLDGLGLTPGQRLTVLAVSGAITTLATLATGKNRSDQAVARVKAVAEVEASRVFSSASPAADAPPGGAEVTADDPME